MRKVALFVGTSILVACGHLESPDRSREHDLVELFPSARVIRETELLDLGEEEARSFIAGFSANETATDGTTFAWGVGAESSVRFFLGARRPLSLRVRCWPFSFPSAPEQTLEVVLNGTPVDRVALQTAVAEYRVQLPAAQQLEGSNEIRFRYAYQRAPRDVLPGATDERPLAVGWDWIRWDGANVASPPERSQERGRDALGLPDGTIVEYFLDVRDRSTFTFAGLRPWNASSTSTARLAVTLQTVSDRWERNFEVPHGEGEWVVDTGSEMARLTLRGSGGSVAVIEPKLITLSAIATRTRDRDLGRPDILVYMVDTLRADRLGVYGSGRDLTPRMDAFAREATVYEHSFAQSSWTRPSTASILTGLLPRDHATHRRTDALPSDVRTLPETLKASGYDTEALVVNANVAPAFGFDRGFDVFEMMLEEGSLLGARSDVLVERALERLDQRVETDWEAPLFLYLHTADPHDPYAPESGSPEELGSVDFMESLEVSERSLSKDELVALVALYDEDVRFADRQFGRVIDWLESRGRYENTLIVLLSDHGEEFADHGWWRHGKTLYQEQLSIPLIIKWPRGEGAGTRVTDAVQHVDLVPALLDYLGIESDRALPGISLYQLLSRPASPRILLGDLRLDGRELVSAVRSGQKLVRYRVYDRPIDAIQLFDLTADGDERNSLVGQRPNVVEFLDAYLQYTGKHDGRASVPADIDGDLERQLRALGYVQ